MEDSTSTFYVIYMLMEPLSPEDPAQETWEQAFIPYTIKHSMLR